MDSARIIKLPPPAISPHFRLFLCHRLKPVSIIQGRNVVLERNYGAPEIVNDGVTIAREISLRDPEENVGARLIQEVASKSDSKAGDGTTTSAIMTQALVNNGMRAVTSGINPVALNRGIRKAARIISDEIKAIATVR